MQAAYESRIARLQATYRLVPATGPVTFVCGSAADEVVVNYSQTKPPTLIADRLREAVAVRRGTTNTSTGSPRQDHR